MYLPSATSVAKIDAAGEPEGADEGPGVPVPVGPVDGVGAGLAMGPVGPVDGVGAPAEGVTLVAGSERSPSSRTAANPPTPTPTTRSTATVGPTTRRRTARRRVGRSRP